MLSPVRMLSLTMHDPFSNIKSQGINEFSGISMISPGIKFELSIA